MFFVASTTKCDSGRAIGAKRRICKYIPGSKQIFIESLAVSSDSEKRTLSEWIVNAGWRGGLPAPLAEWTRGSAC